MSQTYLAMEADGALKDYYLPTVREQLNNASVLLSQVESGSIGVEGRNAVLSLHVERNHGIGARAESGTLPTAGKQGWVEERTELRYNYGRINLTGQVIEATKTDKGAWVRALAAETEGLVTDLRRDVNRQLFGTSDGVIANCGVTSAATTVVLTSPSIVELRQLEVGMVIDIGTVASPTSVASGRTITAVDRSAGTIDISGAAVTTAATDYIFRTGSGGSGASQVELTGLRSIVSDTGALFGIDPATYDSWKSQVNTAGAARDLTDILLEEIIEDIAIEGGKSPNFIVAPHGVRRVYAEGLQANKRFNDTTDLKGGFKALTVAADHVELGFAVDRDAPYYAGSASAGDAYVLNTDCLFQHESSGWDWMDRDGSVLSRDASTDSYTATLYKYHEFTTDKRNAHGVIRRLNVS